MHTTRTKTEMAFPLLLFFFLFFLSILFFYLKRREKREEREEREREEREKREKTQQRLLALPLQEGEGTIDDKDGKRDT